MRDSGVAFVKQIHGLFGVKETPWLVGRLRVFLDGSEVSESVVRGNTEEGWADVLVAGDDGQLLVSAGRFREQRLYGHIKAMCR